MRIPATVILVLSAACAFPTTPPPPSRTLAPGSPAEAFACAMREVNERGYVVADADREAGFIRADRDRTGLGDALLGGIEKYDQLTLTIYPRRDGRTLLRVVTGGYEVQARGDDAGARVSAVGSEHAAADAQAILAACGEPVRDAMALASSAPPRQT
ncbi:MAG TPA: hypothetical protein VHG51_12965 [Longimicrobiaceae bacterium]|nr:hypothetical protein [Longimicrobiaceae bacterium]